MMKKLIKKLLGPDRISFIRKQFEKQEPLVIPKDDPTEVTLRKEFYSGFISRGDIVFDVGANVGNRITPILALGARVVAIEPQASCIRVLKAKFGNAITLVTKGLSDKEEIREFYIADASTISSFSNEWIESVKKDRFKDHSWKSVQKVEMSTLDKLIEKYGIPKFIKIDVEGFELEVLKGLSRRIPYISYEYTSPEQTDKAIACLNYLASLNKNILCNYSAGESMKTELDSWVGHEEMINIIQSEEFIGSGFGDIYIKN